MKFFRIDLLTLLISLFILSSCKRQDGVGLNPDQTLNGTLFVDTNIIVNTVPEDSTITNALAKTPLGYFNDPQIGPTEANVATAISLPLSSAYTVPTGTIFIDSAVLVLRYAEGFYGDSLTSKYKVNVYQLKERPLSTINYYNNRVWDPFLADASPSYPVGTANLLGSKTFLSRTHTKFKITDIVTGAKDTLKSVPAQIRVPISTSFINNNLFGASSSQLSSNTNFQNLVKGLYLTMDKNQVGAGGTFMMALDSSNISVYYRTNNSGTLDTSVVTLPIAQHSANIKHSYTAPGVVSALANTAVSNSTFYIQGLLGLRARVSFPNLQDIVTKAGGNIVINRAELVITPTIGSTIPFPAQPKITMYQLDNTKQRVLLQDAKAATQNAIGDPRYLGQSIFGGIYNSLGLSDYHFIITGYIQDLLLGKTKDYGTYLGAVDIFSGNQTVDIGATPQTGGRLVATGTNFDRTSPDFKYKIKLNVIYTKVAK